MHYWTLQCCAMSSRAELPAARASDVMTAGAIVHADDGSTGSHAPKECQHWNSDYQINVWNATASRALLKEHYEWFLPTYDNYAHPIQRVDAIKYFILYHFGGFYLDLDITCRRQLKPIQRFPAWFPRASPQGVNNDAMATRAQHPVFKKMIDSLESRDRSLIFPYLTVFWSTGPQFVTDLVKQYLDENKQLRNYVAGSSKEDADSDAIYVLPQKFYSEQYSFFGHSPGGTWHEGDVAVVLWFVDRPWAVLGLFALVAWLFAAVVLLRLRSRRSWRISGRNSRSQYTDLTQDDESVSLDDLEALSDVSSRS